MRLAASQTDLRLQRACRPSILVRHRLTRVYFKRFSIKYCDDDAVARRPYDDRSKLIASLIPCVVSARRAGATPARPLHRAAPSPPWSKAPEQTAFPEAAPHPVGDLKNSRKLALLVLPGGESRSPAAPVDPSSRARAASYPGWGKLPFTEPRARSVTSMPVALELAEW